MKKPILAIALVLVILFAACGAPAAPAGDAATAPATAPGDVTLRFGSFQGGTIEEDWVNVQFPRFYEETGIEVEHVFVTHADTISTYLTWGAAGMLPDAAMLSALHLHALVQRGMILNLGQFSADNNINYNFDRYFTNLLGAYKYNDQIYALPSDMDLGLLWYNKNLFDEAGLDHPNPNWTWDDMRTNAMALARGEGMGQIFGVNLASHFVYLWQNGTNTISEDRTRSLMNTPEAHEAFRFMLEMVESGAAVNPNVTEPLFQNGMVGMSAGQGPWFAYYVLVLGEVDFEWGVTALPRGREKATTCFGSTFAVFESSPYHREAFDFITWFLTDEQQFIRAEQFSWFPPSYTVLQMPEFIDNDEVMRMSRDQKNLVLAETNYGMAPIIVAAQAEINTIINRELSLVWAGERNLYDALEQIVSEVDPLLQE
jgi:multiple sugar transport system substrate-binding protein